MTYSQTLAWRGTPQELFDRLAPAAPVAFVRRPLSAFAGFKPVDTFTFRTDQSSDDPLESLQAWIDDHFSDEVRPNMAVGYISFDIKNRLHDYSPHRKYMSIYPEISFHYFEEGVYADFHAGQIRLRFSSISEMQTLSQLLTAPECSGLRAPTAPTGLRFMPFPEYREKISRIHKYLAEGDVYEVNLTEPLRFAYGGDPLSLFARLLAASDAPRACWLQTPDIRILSASPELFLRIKNERIVSRPIKGTRAASDNPSENERVRRELSSATKDRAEHVMIVDVVRNDLGRVCIPGSVGVTDPFAIESFPTIHHMVSTIEGKLPAEARGADVLRATLPAASVTGAPKIRAVQIIDELEETPRGIYTGAIGIIGARRDIDLALAIRTLVIQEGIAVYGAGGGIVIDSDARAEYDECAAKTQVLVRALFDSPESRIIEKDSPLLPDPPHPSAL